MTDNLTTGQTDRRLTGQTDRRLTGQTDRRTNTIIIRARDSSSRATIKVLNTRNLKLAHKRLALHSNFFFEDLYITDLQGNPFEQIKTMDDLYDFARLNISLPIDRRLTGQTDRRTDD